MTLTLPPQMVYVVSVDSNYNNYDVQGAFSTFEKAKKFCESKYCDRLQDCQIESIGFDVPYDTEENEDLAVSKALDDDEITQSLESTTVSHDTGGKLTGGVTN